MSLCFPISLAGKESSALSSPQDIPGLQLWLDGDDGSTMWTLLVGGDPLVANGNVARWMDKSGNGYSFIQGDGLKRPRFNVNVAGLNNQNAVYFDSATLDYMKCETLFALNQTEAKTIFTVARPNSGSGLSDGGSVWSLYTSTATGTGGHVTFEPAYRANLHHWIGSDPATLVGTPPTIQTITQSGAGNFHDVFSFWKNGSAVTRTGGTDGAVVDDATAEMMLGKIGTFTNDLYPLDGFLCEILVYDTELSPTDRQSVEAYLSDKWGVGI